METEAPQNTGEFLYKLHTLSVTIYSNTTVLDTISPFSHLSYPGSLVDSRISSVRVEWVLECWNAIMRDGEKMSIRTEENIRSYALVVDSILCILGDTFCDPGQTSYLLLLQFEEGVKYSVLKLL